MGITSVSASMLIVNQSHSSRQEVPHQSLALGVSLIINDYNPDDEVEAAASPLRLSDCCRSDRKSVV